MKLTKYEKRLLEEVVDAWEQEGNYTTQVGGWGRDITGEYMKPVKASHIPIGRKKIEETMISLNKKFGFTLFE